MKFSLSILATSLMFLTACEQTVDLDLNQTEPILAIEGQVTDKADHNFVKVSRSVGFYDTGVTPRVTNATVTVEDNIGNIFSFAHYQGTSSDSLGMYFPETPFSGEVGRTYTLTVVVDGQTYGAHDTLLPVVPIDQLTSRLDLDEEADPEDPGRFYEVLLYVKEPKEREDYYLFKCYRNDELEYANETDIYFSDDQLLSESIDGIPMPIYYAKNDIARIEAYSLTRDAFVFYRDLQKLLNNDGGIFGNPPANPRSNITNGAIGFFQVSAVQDGVITIE